jgi:hypothetical protein
MSGDHNMNQSDVNTILNERGSRYGKFVDVAKATHDIQQALYDNINLEKLVALPPDMAIALDMICHKLARIAVGDADYVDNWVDISGYSKLIADRLEGVER